MNNSSKSGCPLKYLYTTKTLIFVCLYWAKWCLKGQQFLNQWANSWNVWNPELMIPMGMKIGKVEASSELLCYCCFSSAATLSWSATVMWSSFPMKLPDSKVFAYGKLAGWTSMRTLADKIANCLSKFTPLVNHQPVPLHLCYTGYSCTTLLPPLPAWWPWMCNFLWASWSWSQWGNRQEL